LVQSIEGGRMTYEPKSVLGVPELGGKFAPGVENILIDISARICEPCAVVSYVCA
jgi:hypothetical protein